MRYTQGVALGCVLLGPSARCIVESNLFAYISIFDTPSSAAVCVEGSHSPEDDTCEAAEDAYGRAYEDLPQLPVVEVHAAAHDSTGDEQGDA